MLTITRTAAAALAAFMLLGACKDREPPPTVTVTSAPVAFVDAGVTVSPADDVAVDVPTSRLYAFSYATFRKGDTLTQCTDVMGEISVLPSQAAMSPAQFDAYTDKTLAGMKEVVAKRKGAMPIAQQCSAAFADRTVLASCTEEMSGTGVRVSGITRFYDFGNVGLSDTSMHACMKPIDGRTSRWSALSRDSDEYRFAKLHYDLDKVRKMIRDGE